MLLDSEQKPKLICSSELLSNLQTKQQIIGPINKSDLISILDQMKENENIKPSKEKYWIIRKSLCQLP